MFRRILVPLDGSKRAEQALSVASRLARVSDGTILLVRVVPVASEYDRYMGGMLTEPNSIMSAAVEQDAIDAAFDEARSYLEITTKELEGIKFETKVLFGPAAVQILDAIQSLQSDLVVLCSHGYTGFKRWTLGSVADKVVRHSSVPVLLLHEHAGVPTNLHPEGIRPVRILVALDGSYLAETAVMPAAQLSAALSAPAPGSLHLAWVLPLTATDVSGEVESRVKISEQDIKDAETYLNTVKQWLDESEAAPANLLVTTSVDIGVDVAETLISMAEVGQEESGAEIKKGEGFGGCDVIALATHGRGGIQRWVVGSVTERILSASRLPLLIVQPQTMMRTIDEVGEMADSRSSETEGARG